MILMEKHNKITSFIVISFLLCFFCACDAQNIETKPDSTTGADNTTKTDETRGDVEMNERNKTIVAEALGVDESERSLRYIMSSMDEVGIGEIQSAEAIMQNGEETLFVIGNNGDKYTVYLSKNGYVEAIRNDTTGEWLIKSER